MFMASCCKNAPVSFTVSVHLFACNNLRMAEQISRHSLCLSISKVCFTGEACWSVFCVFQLKDYASVS
jgi:hypothetical protein